MSNTTSPPAARLLREWATANDLSLSQIATTLGLSRQRLQHWMNGRNSPPVASVLAVEALTRNYVRASDWLTPAEAAKARDARRAL